ncbi:MAG: heme o synthase [Alphaproteobacteria bacterium]|nr:heme o synthase [Alphaproteobacteria bacterium]
MVANSTVTSTDTLAASSGSVGDFVALLKPRVMSLVVFTGAVGLYLAPGEIHPFLAAVSVLCIAVAAGASGAINMWYDRDIDRVMRRTQGRPIPTGRVCSSEALTFGVVLGAVSVCVMGLATNWLAAALLALTIGFYVFVYTIWLKRRTPHNIVIGGAAGAFPPVIGWAAATGEIGLAPLSLCALIFLWTPPHFWALSLFRREDYTRAGVPMLPVVAGERETRRHIWLYSLVLVPASLAPWALGVIGPLYGAIALVLGAVFLWRAWQVRCAADGDYAGAKRLFGFSILYLFGLFFGMAGDCALWRALAG